MNTRVEPELDASSVRVNRIDLVERLWQAARTQVAAHEARLKLLEPGDAASEGHAKALATLARTLKELIELQAAAADAERMGEVHPHDADPRDADAGPAFDSLEALRSELARRLAGLGDSGAGALDRATDTG